MDFPVPFVTSASVCYFFGFNRFPSVGRPLLCAALSLSSVDVRLVKGNRPVVDCLWVPEGLA